MLDDQKGSLLATEEVALRTTSISKVRTRSELSTKSLQKLSKFPLCRQRNTKSLKFLGELVMSLEPLKEKLQSLLKDLSINRVL